MSGILWRSKVKRMIEAEMSLEDTLSTLYIEQMKKMPQDIKKIWSQELNQSLRDNFEQVCRAGNLPSAEQLRGGILRWLRENPSVPQHMAERLLNLQHRRPQLEEELIRVRTESSECREKLNESRQNSKTIMLRFEVKRIFKKLILWSIFLAIIWLAGDFYTLVRAITDYMGVDLYTAPIIEILLSCGAALIIAVTMFLLADVLFRTPKKIHKALYISALLGLGVIPAFVRGLSMSINPLHTEMPYLSYFDFLLWWIIALCAALFIGYLYERRFKKNLQDYYDKSSKLHLNKKEEFNLRIKLKENQKEERKIDKKLRSIHHKIENILQTEGRKQQRTFGRLDNFLASLLSKISRISYLYKYYSTEKEGKD